MSQNKCSYLRNDVLEDNFSGIDPVGAIHPDKCSVISKVQFTVLQIPPSVIVVCKAGKGKINGTVYDAPPSVSIRSDTGIREINFSVG